MKQKEIKKYYNKFVYMEFRAHEDRFGRELAPVPCADFLRCFDEDRVIIQTHGIIHNDDIILIKEFVFK